MMKNKKSNISSKSKFNTETVIKSQSVKTIYPNSTCQSHGFHESATKTVETEINIFIRREKRG